MKNKIKFLLITIILLFCNSSYASLVDSTTAKLVAQNYYQFVTGASTKVNLELAHFEIENNVPVYYVFDVNNGGWVIVSAEDSGIPIIGYSKTGVYSTNNLSPEFEYWMGGYKQQILYLRINNIPPTPEIEQFWLTSLTNQFDHDQYRVAAVNPLLSTTWDQGNYYNAQCPGGSVTGCVATAMAMIMKYWNSPTQGNSTHTYFHPTYGTLSANFGATTYNWNAMPNNLTSPNSSVATLMFHCGVSVNMDYSPSVSGAWVLTNDLSGYHPNSAQNAYTTYFNFNAVTIQGVEKSNYSTSNWTNLIKDELDNSRPVQYAGWNNSGNSGHTWVCDGYDNSNYFHMNWGWGGAGNGYFNLSGLNPLGSNFNSNQQALIGIQPTTSGPLPPLNDNCIGAIQLTDNTSCVTTFGTVDGATPDGFPTIPSCNGGSSTQLGVFYYFVAQSSNVTINVTPTNSSSSGLDPVVVVYSGSSCANLNEIPGGCMDDNGTGDPESLSVNVTSGQQYWIRVYDYGAIQPPIGNGGFNICVSHSGGGTCTFSLSSSSASIGQNGGSYSFNVIPVSGNCSWNATTSESWIHLTTNSGSTGGNNVVNYYVDPCTGSNRIGSINVAGNTFTISQQCGTNCSFSLSNSSVSFSSYGGNCTLFVIPVSGNCSWVATTSVSWIQLYTFSGNSNGNQNLVFHVDQNFGQARSTFIEVNGDNILISQDCGQTPVADFYTANSNSTTGSVVQLFDLSSSNTTSWVWTITPLFGYYYTNGTNQNSQNPQVVFTTQGCYTVELQAQNACGFDDELKNNFICISNGNSTFNLIEPLNVANICNPVNVLFDWEDVPGATSYGITVSYDYAQNNIAWNSGLSGSYVYTNNPNPNLTYYWSVCAYNNIGIISTSPTWSFSTYCYTGIEEYVDSDELMIFPNPNSTGIFKIKSGDLINKYEVVNEIGQIILIKELMIPINTEFQINLTSNESGLYFLKLHRSKDVIIKKLIKQ